MVGANEIQGKFGLSKQEIEAIRRERDALALRISESQATIEQSKDLLRRLDQILAACGE